MKHSTLLLLATACLLQSCGAETSSWLEVGTERSLSIVRDTVDKATSTRFSAGYHPTLERRFWLGRGIVVDLISVRSDVIDAHETYLVAAGMELEPFILFGASDAVKILNAWWPQSGNETLDYCTLAARAQWRWPRAIPVVEYATVDADVLVADPERLLFLTSPFWQDLTSVQAGVDFWLVHSGGSTRLRCRLSRESGGRPTLVVEKLDSLPGLGFYRLGG